jgi:hypothetical protein
MFLDDVDYLVEEFYIYAINMFSYIACNHDHHMPSHLMHHLHNHLYKCIIQDRRRKCK